jgi:hypothetical protein
MTYGAGGVLNPKIGYDAGGEFESASKETIADYGLMIKKQCLPTIPKQSNEIIDQVHQS